MLDIGLGDYRAVFAERTEPVDAVIADPPYGSRTRKGHDTMVDRAVGYMRPGAGRPDSPRRRREISYRPWSYEDVSAFVQFWVPRCSGWFAVFSCSDLAPTWRAAFEEAGLYAFAPVPCVTTGMTVRKSGDGPASWATYLNVARPRSARFMGGWSNPGAYVLSSGGPRGEQHIGGKDLRLMRSIVRDYSRDGWLICDPVAGYGTTGVAALMEGRRFVGAEIDPATRAKALERIAPSGFSADGQGSLF